MRVIVKDPERESEYREIDNTLEAMQEIVGGYIECISVDRDIVIVCNEEGKMRGLPINMPWCGDLLVGTIIVCGTDDDGEFTDVPLTLEEWKKITHE